MQRGMDRRHPLRRAVAVAASVAAIVAALTIPAAVSAADPPERTGPEPAFPRAAGAPETPAGDRLDVIIRYRSHPGAADVARIKAANGTVRHRYSIVDAVAATVPEAALPGLRRAPGVVGIETDGRLTAFEVGADYEYTNAWGVNRLGTKLVHQAGYTGAGVKVAVIDTGLDYIHYDPTANPVIYSEFNAAYAGFHEPYVGGWDFVNSDADPMDDNGHGTHVSGILAAELNGYLVAGMAPGVDLYALKVLGPSGEGDYSGLIAALDWAVQHDIDIVNMSLGGHEVSQALADAVAAAYDAGLIMVAAAGNVNPLVWQELIYGCPVAYPGAYPQVLSTPYTNTADELTGFSCTGPEVDFAAPGDQIYSTVPIGPAGSCMFCSPLGYAAESGTSMASPHLAGLIALVLDHGIADANADGKLSPEIKTHLCANTTPGGRIAQTDPRYPKWYGCGIINAEKAILLDPPETGGPLPNRAPVAVADTVTTTEDTTAFVDVLINDSDPDSDPLTVTATTPGAHGTTSVSLGGLVTYVPATDWSGTDSFSYTVSDGRGGSGTSSVTVTVVPVNDPPVAGADSASTAEDTAVSIAVLANDTDVDGDTLAVTGVGPADHGTAVNGPGGQVTYTPAANWSGTDSFSYTVGDGQGGSASASVSVTVTAVNDPPVAGADNASTPYQTAVVLPVLANDSDADGDTLAVASVMQPAHGTASTNGTTVTYTPAAGWSGPDGFSYVVSDGHGGTASAAVSVTVGAAPPSTVMHVGDLDQSASLQRRNWTAQVTVLVVDGNGGTVSGATVTGNWSGGAKGSGSCITGASGTCTIAKSGIALSKTSATFTVGSVTRTGWTYNAAANTDPDPAGSGQASNGRSITVIKPA